MTPDLKRKIEEMAEEKASALLGFDILKFEDSPMWMDEATFFLFEVPDFPKGDDSNVL